MRVLTIPSFPVALIFSVTRFSEFFFPPFTMISLFRPCGGRENDVFIWDGVRADVYDPWFLVSSFHPPTRPCAFLIVFPLSLGGVGRDLYHKQERSSTSPDEDLPRIFHISPSHYGLPFFSTSSPPGLL